LAATITNEPPAPASLVDSIHQGAGLAPLELVASHTLSLRTDAPPTNMQDVDDPPSLIEAIQGARR
jgi:hypothetical protein